MLPIVSLKMLRDSEQFKELWAVYYRKNNARHKDNHPLIESITISKNFRNE